MKTVSIQLIDQIYRFENLNDLSLEKDIVQMVSEDLKRSRIIQTPDAEQTPKNALTSQMTKKLESGIAKVAFASLPVA